MLSFFLPYSFIIILILFFFIKLTDINTLFLILSFTLVVEFILSFFFFKYSINSGVIFYTNIGKINLINLDFNLNLTFIYDELSFIFHCILFIALSICLVFLLQYYEYDIYSHTLILLSSLFSQLAFIYFLTFDLFLLICFWEWISIVSFFLVQHWNIRITTIKAALKVFVISQIGDYFFFISIFLLILIFENSNIGFILANYKIFLCIFYNFFFLSFNVLNVISLLVSFSLFLKSAQFIFFPWLLDAMEAPVPISAQLHSSTLVIIGFYVFYRLQELILISKYTMLVYFFFSFMTICFTTFLGFFQDDGKKLLACSTGSQLGYIILTISINFVNESLYLLIFLCCSKALTFVWFGVIMDKNSGISDFRLIKNTSWTFFEKSGLFFSLINSTILPGSVIWSIKSLLYSGKLVSDFYFFFIVIEILSLTWFFSLIYLFKLFSFIFFLSARGSNLNNSNYFLNYFGITLKMLYFNKNFFFFIVSLLFSLAVLPVGFNILFFLV